MTDLLTLEAEVRTDLGKGASRRLRHANKVPAILYGEKPRTCIFNFRAQKTFSVLNKKKRSTHKY